VSSAQGPFQHRAPAEGIWYFLNRLLFVLILLVLGTVALYHFLPEVSKRRDQQARVEELKVEVEKQRQLLVRNTRIQELLMHDPDYVGLIARDRLDLMKEGETIYRFDPPKPSKSEMRLVH
jgi:cell division protein FtsB